MAWAVAAVLAVVTVAFAALFLNRPAIEQSVVRLAVGPAGTNVDGLALSPDGRHLAFVSPDAGPLLWVRSLDTLGTRALAGTEGAEYPFWSPDSRAIGFFTGGALKTIELTGGGAQTVCALQTQGRGGTWNDDDVMLFGSLGGGLRRVPAAGGDPVPVTAIDEQPERHMWPQFLPDGDHFLFLNWGRGSEQEGIYVGSLASDAATTLVLRTSQPARYAAPGYLLFGRDPLLMAQPFDLDLLSLTGDALPIVDSVQSNSTMRWLGVSSPKTSVVSPCE